MKSSITPTPSVFQPLTLTITIESPQELASLWHRMNENYGTAANLPLGGVWRKLDEVARARGINIMEVL